MQEDAKTIRLKQLYYRSIHRGCKETDLLFARFAHHALTTLCDAELKEYETLLEEADSDIWQWFVGQQSLPGEKNNAVWKLFCQVNQG